LLHLPVPAAHPLPLLLLLLLSSPPRLPVLLLLMMVMSSNCAICHVLPCLLHLPVR
jgi:hypothetical protein